MNNLTKVCAGVICALSVTAVVAQSEQPTVQPRGAAQARPPLQTAQAPAPAGGAATGATGATATVGGMSAGTIAFVAIGVVAVAAAANNTSSTTSH